MKRLLLLSLLFLLSCGIVWAQIPVAPLIVPVATAPSGSCVSGLPDQQVVSTGVLYSCLSGVWGVVGPTLGQTVTFTPQTAAGTGATVSCYTASGNQCSNISGMVYLHTGSSPTVGVLFDVNWTTPLAHSQNCTVSAGGGLPPETAAALLPGTNNSGTTSFGVEANVAPSASTDYYFMYVCSDK